MATYRCRHISSVIDSGVDRKMYQTVYAKEGFSIAAPDGRMHFTEELFGAA